MFRRREREQPTNGGAAEEPAEQERERAGPPAAREPVDRPARGRPLAGRAGEAGASVVGAAGSGVLMIARLVRMLVGLIVLLIVLAIVLRDVDANARNTIVKGIHEGANFFAGAFTGLIEFNGHPKRAITINWGIAAIVYLIAGAVVAGFIARIGRGGRRFERAHRMAPR
ncbi:MAG TPA: hypothetical protein VFY36_04860 [Solirubrobacteraceae bacterium]|nr:hypothetical protein [Solirubrobacteraceae bacterium]